MARKIICDLCGKECVNGHATLALMVSHATRDDEEIGMDHFRQKDLCLPCADDVRRQFGFTMVPMHGMDGPDMAQPVLYRE